jgi:hypothetical protein
MIELWQGAGAFSSPVTSRVVSLQILRMVAGRRMASNRARVLMISSFLSLLLVYICDLMRALLRRIGRWM